MLATALDALITYNPWTLSPATTLAEAARLLDETGRLLLVEGFWHTGSGLTAAQAEALLRGAGREPTTYPLADPVLWGGPITDERYLLVA